MRIWAHRGCSLRYPENTLLAFEKAAELNGLEGIELDVQLSKDGELVIMHDERLDRTTDGIGFVKDYTLTELKKFHVKTVNHEFSETIPTLNQVLELLQKQRLKLNIELKNSEIMYPGMEEKIIALVHKYGFEDRVIYSSFYAKSLERIRQLLPEAEIGILDVKASDCLYKLNGKCGANAIHPYAYAIDLDRKDIAGITVRAWLTESLYPEKQAGKINIKKLEEAGITDVFLNDPEMYLIF